MTRQPARRTIVKCSKSWLVEHLTSTHHGSQMKSSMFDIASIHPAGLMSRHDECSSSSGQSRIEEVGDLYFPFPCSSPFLFPFFPLLFDVGPLNTSRKSGEVM